MGNRGRDAARAQGRRDEQRRAVVLGPLIGLAYGVIIVFATLHRVPSYLLYWNEVWGRTVDANLAVLLIFPAVLATNLTKVRDYCCPNYLVTDLLCVLFGIVEGVIVGLLIALYIGVRARTGQSRRTGNA